MITLVCDECRSTIISTEHRDTAIQYIKDHAAEDCDDKILCHKCKNAVKLPPCPICGRLPRVSRPPVCNGYEVACMDNYHMISFHDYNDEQKVRDQWTALAVAGASALPPPQRKETDE